MIRVIQHGLGIQGRQALKIMLKKRDLKVVAAADVDPSLLGKDAGEVVGSEKTGIIVQHPSEILNQIKEGKLGADVVTNTTVTSLQKVFEQVKPFIEMNINVVTTSAEANYPWNDYPQLALEIDSLAKKHGVRFMQAGINPELLSATLPLILSGASRIVRKVVVRRVVDYREYDLFSAGQLKLDEKIRPLGITPEKFADGVKDGHWKLGWSYPFPAITQKLHIVAFYLGWKLDSVDVKFEPIISRTQKQTPWGFVIEPGTTTGWKQIGSGFMGEEEKVRIEALGIYKLSPEDGVNASVTVSIDGEPKHFMEITGGSVEDSSYVTSIRLVNILPQVLKGPLGFITPMDLPMALPLAEISQ